MNDSLLKELGKLARSQEEAERAHLDERWDRLAADTLTAEEEAELKALAGSSPETREAYAAFQPLGADFQARVVSEINAQRSREARVLRFRQMARRVEVWAGAAAAVAATVFFMTRDPALQPVPHSIVEVMGGDQTTRGKEPELTSGPPSFSPGSGLKLRVGPLPPQETRDLEAYVFRAPAGQAKEPWVLVPGFDVKKGAHGFILLDGEVDEKVLPAGLWRMCVVLSRVGKAPKEGELPAALAEEHTDWQADCAEPLRIQNNP